MILEPKHKNFTGPLQIKVTVKKIFNIRRHMSIPRAFECYYFKIILNWWHSPFKPAVSFRLLGLALKMHTWLDPDIPGSLLPEIYNQSIKLIPRAIILNFHYMNLPDYVGWFQFGGEKLGSFFLSKTSGKNRKLSCWWCSAISRQVKIL
jgi:hypothetical protein